VGRLLAHGTGLLARGFCLEGAGCGRLGTPPVDGDKQGTSEGTMPADNRSINRTDGLKGSDMREMWCPDCGQTMPLREWHDHECGLSEARRRMCDYCCVRQIRCRKDGTLLPFTTWSMVP
jgi:hypothetical protein